MTPGADASDDTTSVHRRTYGDGCAIARALDLIGERWALLVLRELLFGPKRFTDLQAGVPNARPNVLSQRLRELEQSAVIRRRKLGLPARAWVYELTEFGQSLEPVLVELGRWGRQVPYRPQDSQVSLDSLMFALKSHVDPAKCQGLTATYLIAIEDDPYSVRIDDGHMTISRGEPDSPDVAVHTDRATFTALITEGRPLNLAQTEGRLELTGDASAFDRLLEATT